MKCTTTRHVSPQEANGTSEPGQGQATWDSSPLFSSHIPFWDVADGTLGSSLARSLYPTAARAHR
jgi:hypothetical protein